MKLQTILERLDNALASGDEKELAYCASTPDAELTGSPLQSFPIFNTSLVSSYAYFRLPKGGIN